MPHKSPTAITLLLIALVTAACDGKSEAEPDVLKYCLVRDSHTVQAVPDKGEPFELPAGFPLRMEPDSRKHGELQVFMPTRWLGPALIIRWNDRDALTCKPADNVPAIKEKQIWLCEALVGTRDPKRPQVLTFPKRKFIRLVGQGASLGKEDEVKVEHVDGSGPKMWTSRLAVTKAAEGC